MGYLSEEEVSRMGFRHCGSGVMISDRAAIYDRHTITISDNCRIDDFCLLSGELIIGPYTHLAPYAMLAGGEAGINIGKYVTIAYGVKVFSETDDYSGNGLVGSLVPRRLKTTLEKGTIFIGDFCILGTNSTIMPGARLEEGVAVGAHTLVKTNLEGWGVYCGVPAARLKNRSRRVKDLFLQLHRSG